MVRSILSIIARKILDSLNALPLMSIISAACLFCISCAASLFVFSPEKAQAISLVIITWKNYAFIKTMFIFVLVFNFGRMAQMVVKTLNNATRPRQIQTSDNIEGIPTVELLDHLFTLETFKREDIEKKFGIPRNRYATLATRLESLGVLVRGDNNARVLNKEYARADVAAILDGVTSAKDIKRVSRQVSANSYSSEPSAREVAENVIAAIDSPRRFELHKLENMKSA